MKENRKSRLSEKRSLERSLLETVRSIYESQYNSVRLVWFHSRRQKSKWICDGKIILRDKLDYRSEDVPDEAWETPENIGEFAEMMGG